MKKHYLKLKPLEQQVIVITGATSGIGLVTARMAAAKGAKVAAAGRNKEALNQLVEELQKKGSKAIGIKANVSKEEDVDRLQKVILKEFGTFGTWINNASVSIFGKTMDMSIEDQRQIMEINFWGSVYGSRAAANHFIGRGEPGALINVGSFYGDRGATLKSPYVAAKHALHGWTEVLRMELEKEKQPVSVTLIHPGRIDTPYNEHAKSYINKQPAHRGMIYPPESVAKAILYAAEHPKRDLFIGGQAKFGALLGNVAPRLTDAIMKKGMIPTQHLEKPSQAKEDNALYQPGFGMQARGQHKGWHRSGSVYAAASKNPLRTALAFGSLGLLFVLSGSASRTK